MKLAPDRKKFMEVIGGSGDITADIEKFCTNFSPLLEENHKFLVRYLGPFLGLLMMTNGIYLKWLEQDIELYASSLG